MEPEISLSSSHALETATHFGPIYLRPTFPSPSSLCLHLQWSSPPASSTKTLHEFIFPRQTCHMHCPSRPLGFIVPIFITPITMVLFLTPVPSSPQLHTATWTERQQNVSQVKPALYSSVQEKLICYSLSRESVIFYFFKDSSCY